MALQVGDKGAGPAGAPPHPGAPSPGLQDEGVWRGGPLPPCREGNAGPGSRGRVRAGGEAGWGLLDRWGTLCPPFCMQFEAFCAGGLAPGWSLLVQGHSDSGEDK